MSKDVLTALLLILLGLITWTTMDFIHRSKETKLPVEVEKYLTPVNPVLLLDR